MNLHIPRTPGSPLPLPGSKEHERNMALRREFQEWLDREREIVHAIVTNAMREAMATGSIRIVIRT